MDYTNHVRKSELVSLFWEEISPRASELLAAVSGVQAGDAGIIDATPKPKTRKSRETKSPTKKKSLSRLTPELEAPPDIQVRRSPRRSPSKQSLPEPELEIISASPRKVSKSSAPAPTDSPRKRGRPRKVKEPSPEPIPEPEPLPVAEEPSYSDDYPEDVEEEVIQYDLDIEGANLDEFEVEELVAPIITTSPQKSPKKSKRRLSKHVVDPEASEEDRPKKRKSKETKAAEKEAEKAAKKARKKKDRESIKSVFSKEDAELKDESFMALKEETPVKVKKDENDSPFTSKNVFQTTPGKKRKRTTEDGEESGKKVRHVDGVKLEEESSFPDQSMDQSFASVGETLPGLSSIPSLSPPNYMVLPPQPAQTPGDQYSSPPHSTSTSRINRFMFSEDQEEESPVAVPSSSNSRMSFMPSVDELNLSSKFAEELKRQKGVELNEKVEYGDDDEEEDESEDVETAELKTSTNAKGKVNSKPVVYRAKKPSVFSKIDFKSIFFNLFKLVTIGTLLVGLATTGAWYRKEKFAVGYCGTGEYNSVLSNYDGFIEFWSEVLPACTPCPENAECFENFDLECDEGFVAEAHPLSFNGFVPLPPKCVYDTRIVSVAQQILDFLRLQNAHAECGAPGEDGTNEVVQTEFSYEELYNFGRDNVHAFDDKVWTQAMKAVGEQDDIIVRFVCAGQLRTAQLHLPPDFLLTQIRTIRKRESHTATRMVDGKPEVYNEDVVVAKEIFQSNSDAYFTLRCKCDRFVRGWLADNQFYILGFLIAISAAIVGKEVYNQRKREESQIADLVKKSMARIIEQAREADADTTGLFGPRFIALPQLRDELLSDIPSGTKRTALWQKVRDVVEQNSNVEAITKEFRGEVTRVWEWIGNL